VITSTFSPFLVDGIILEGFERGDRFGSAVASAGDINGDGFSDIIVGADRASPNGNFIAGESYIYFGQKPSDAVVRVGTVADQTLAGGDLADSLSGLGGSDELFGNGGSDFLLGGDGDDLLIGGAGSDEMIGGAGQDTLSYRFSKAGVSIDLSAVRAVGGDAEGDRFRSVENIEGSELADVLTGNGRSNVLSGWGGRDTLHGGDGNDRLSGGALADTLDGGDGSDILTGGSQNDTFVFSAVSVFPSRRVLPDTITDFTAGDRIDLSAIDADVSSGGDQSFVLSEGAMFSSPGHVFWTNKAAGTILRLDVNGDRQSDLTIILENWRGSLSNSDFVL
jgi:Ca2+-binding RTX toxin-like protein